MGEGTDSSTSSGCSLKPVAIVSSLVAVGALIFSGNTDDAAGALNVVGTLAELAVGVIAGIVAIVCWLVILVTRAARRATQPPHATPPSAKIVSEAPAKRGKSQE